MKKIFLIPMLLALGSSTSIANTVDKDINELSNDASAIKSGEKLYMQICAACHNKDLSGATGFNLKDGEWVHGDSPSQVLINIKNGFNDKGMPAFGGMFSEAQLKEVTAFILSKREGLEDLRFKIYQMNDTADTAVTADKLIKTGKSSKNLMDFEMPEVKHYAIEFEGILHAPKTPSKFHVDGWKIGPTKLWIDGKERIKANPNMATWPLKPGKQQLKFQYIVANDIKKSWKKNLPIFITNEDLGVKLFGISTRSHKIMLDKKIHVTATDEIVVQRKKIHNLPTYSISVGFPEKINYAFNTRSCDVVGLWKGDLLNVGPNVESRGQDGSIVLGDWLLNKKDSFTMQSQGKCRYKKMENKDSPSFFFSRNGIDYKLSTSNPSAASLTFKYTIMSGNAKDTVFTLPSSGRATYSSPEGNVVGKTLNIKPQNNAFSIHVLAK